MGLHLAPILARAGFDVRPLPIDRNPSELRGLIFFSSFVSETAVYREYVAKNAIGLYTFVDKGNVLDIFAEYDIILDGTDNFATRKAINRACVQARHWPAFWQAFSFPVAVRFCLPYQQLATVSFQAGRPWPVGN